MMDHFVVDRDVLDREFRKGSPFLRMIQREGKVLYAKDLLQEWESHASEDLAQAEHLMTGGFHRGACFSAQQALQKGLKTALLRKGWELERIHNIRRLVALYGEYAHALDWPEEDLDFMDSIYRSGYPAGEALLPLREPNAKDAARAVTIAGGILGEIGISVER